MIKILCMIRKCRSNLY